MATLFYESKLTKIYHGDARNMAELEEDSIGLIVTSPPYWDLKNYSTNSQIGLGQSYEEYLTELDKVFAECCRVLRPGHFFALVIGTRVSDGELRHIPSDAADLLRKRSLTLKKEIIWVKPKGTQGLWQRGTTQYLKQKPYPGCANINIQHEFILIFQKEGPFEVREDVRLPEQFIKEVCWSVWELPVSKTKGHPAPFPKELPRRLIQMFSNPEDVVLDPFLGSGTTCLAASELGRRSVGYEISADFCRLAAAALAEAECTIFEVPAEVAEGVAIAEEDWEFVDANTRYATHDFHPYASKFIPQIARRLIATYSQPGETVLDVFCGSGTTLVEAKMLGRKAIGVDLNPLACLISKVKVTSISEEQLELVLGPFMQTLEKHIRFLRQREGEPHQLVLGLEEEKKGEDFPSICPPPRFPYADRWFQPQVITELRIITTHIKIVEEPKLHDFLLCALSAILRSVSNAASDFGNLMIDKNKRKITDAFERFRQQVVSMTGGMREFNEQCSDQSTTVTVVAGDARRLDFLPDESIDLIVTHPPYIAAVPYAEYQKLSLNWLGEYFADQFQGVAAENLKPRILDRKLIGGQRAKKGLVERFDTDMRLVFREMFRVLAGGRHCCIVIGNPIVNSELVALNQSFKEMGQVQGFEFLEEIARGKYQTTMGKMKEEYILIFRKPK